MLTERRGACRGPAAGRTVGDFEPMIAGSDSVPAESPGDPGTSPIVEVQHDEHYSNVSAEELWHLIDWIAIGAPGS